MRNQLALSLPATASAQQLQRSVAASHSGPGAECADKLLCRPVGWRNAAAMPLRRVDHCGAIENGCPTRAESSSLSCRDRSSSTGVPMAGLPPALLGPVRIFAAFPWTSTALFHRLSPAVLRCLSLTVRCLFHCLSTAVFRCLSLTFHCLFHCLSPAVFRLPAGRPRQVQSPQGITDRLLRALRAPHPLAVPRPAAAAAALPLPGRPQARAAVRPCGGGRRRCCDLQQQPQLRGRGLHALHQRYRPAGLRPRLPVRAAQLHVSCVTLSLPFPAHPTARTAQSSSAVHHGVADGTLAGRRCCQGPGRRRLLRGLRVPLGLRPMELLLRRLRRGREPLCAQDLCDPSAGRFTAFPCPPAGRFAAFPGPSAGRFTVFP